MITRSDDRQRSDAGKGAMEIDWRNPGIGTYVRAHPGHSASFGDRCANVVFRVREFTLSGLR
ncbi:hypothetical protein GCM10027575_04080 [Phytohabitans suffuscus]